jgi:glucose-1-phosphate cytidylyltransferase
MKTVILAGGFGTRLLEETSVKPKPMVEVGGYPILWHLMNSYATRGFGEFVLALGYKGEVIKNYFSCYALLESDLTVNLATGQVDYHRLTKKDWLIDMIDTGPETMTGGRLKRLESRIRPEGTFMMTYGDGLCDVDMRALLQFHRSHGKAATITAVRPPARFGTMQFAGDQVVDFAEKPQTGEGWINGGFFVLEPRVFDYIDGDSSSWETEPLSRLAQDGELMAYRHSGFWQCMDTLRDKNRLEEMWQNGDAPWKVW